MTGFTPELVERVRMAVWNAVEDMHGDIRTGAQSDVIADAALEASGIAELTEALEKIAEHGRKRLRRPNRQTFIAEAALAKHGGRSQRDAPKRSPNT